MGTCTTIPRKLGPQEFERAKVPSKFSVLRTEKLDQAFKPGKMGFEKGELDFFFDSHVPADLLFKKPEEAADLLEIGTSPRLALILKVDEKVLKFVHLLECPGMVFFQKRS